MKNDDASLRMACEKNGLLWARAQLSLLSDGASQQVIRTWIAESNLREQAALQLVRNRLAAAAAKGNMAPLVRNQTSTPGNGLLSLLDIFNLFL